MIYFDHDTGAMSDPKMTELCIECGPGAIAAYWCIIEQIYRDESPLVLFANQDGNRTLTKVVSHWLCIDSETLESWVSEMLGIGLLETDENNPNAVTSKRAMANIEAYKAKQETARQNGKKGGRKTQPKPNKNLARRATRLRLVPRRPTLRQRPRPTTDAASARLRSPSGEGKAASGGTARSAAR